MYLARNNGYVWDGYKGTSTEYFLPDTDYTYFGLNLNNESDIHEYFDGYDEINENLYTEGLSVSPDDMSKLLK